MKLSKNFSLSEFTKSAGINIVPTQEQIYCLKILANDILQPIRDKFGNTIITSGLRNMASYEALKNQGHPVSLSSDHFAWSKENPSGTGAADIICRDIVMFIVFKWIQTNIMTEVGQVIYYPDKGFVHVSNRFSKIFCMPDLRKEETRIMIYKNRKFIPYKT